MADVPTLSITLLGAGQEVGRSCCVLQYRGRTIVCDTGVHPAYSGIASLPFIDELDWSTVDVILITQYVLFSLRDATGRANRMTKLPLGSCCGLDIHYRKGMFCLHRMCMQSSCFLKTNFRDGKGKIYMTHPTKALHKFMMQDFVRMGYACP